MDNVTTPAAQSRECVHNDIASSVVRASIQRSPLSAKQYWMPPHLRACSTATGAILLDLERNRYFGVGRVEARALLSLVSNCPEPEFQARDGSDPIPAEKLERIAQSLLDAGLLTHNAPTDPECATSEIDLVGTMTSVGHEVEHPVSIRFGHAINFLGACAWAKRAVRSRTLYSVACEISRKKRQPSECFDVHRAVELVCIFRRLRPFAFTAQDKCLFHALALVRFLSCYRIHPAWVIGVRARPWAAHSWVQQGSLLLDSNPEHVCEYTPILIV